MFPFTSRYSSVSIKVKKKPFQWASFAYRWKVFESHLRANYLNFMVIQIRIIGKLFKLKKGVLLSGWWFSFQCRIFPAYLLIEVIFDRVWRFFFRPTWLFHFFGMEKSDVWRVATSVYVCLLWVHLCGAYNSLVNDSHRMWVVGMCVARGKNHSASTCALANYV